MKKKSDNFPVNLNKKTPSKKLTPHTKPVTTDSLALYLTQIQKYELLTKEEEKKIALEYRKTGDVLLAQKLVTSNLRFVIKIASQYSQLGVQLIELIQQGNIGLMHAVKEYNPNKDTRLITYAVWWIRGYIQEYLRKQYSIVKIATTPEQRKLFYALQREKDKIDELGHSAVIKQLSGKLNLSEKQVEEMNRRVSQRDVSLEEKVRSDGNTTFLELQKTQDSVEDKLIEKEKLWKVQEGIKKLRPSLNKKELFLLDHRILSDNPLTLQEIGTQRGVSREAVRQMEARLIKKIKNLIEEKA